MCSRQQMQLCEQVGFCVFSLEHVSPDFSTRDAGDTNETTQTCTKSSSCISRHTRGPDSSPQKQKVHLLYKKVRPHCLHRRHGADGVADSAPVGVNRLYGYRVIACRDGCSVICLEELATLHPFSGDHGAGGHTAEVSGAQAFDQRGCRAVDDGSVYRRWWDGSTQEFQ